MCSSDLPNISDISPNTSDISPNISDISPNISDISPNISDISPNRSDISPNISVNVIFTSMEQNDSRLSYASMVVRIIIRLMMFFV